MRRVEKQGPTMSFWVCAYCNESVASITPRQLREGIGKRLHLLTYLFCPPNEEDPDSVLRRLRIENSGTANAEFQTYLMYYQEDSPLFIRIDRQVKARS